MGAYVSQHMKGEGARRMAGMRILVLAVSSLGACVSRVVCDIPPLSLRYLSDSTDRKPCDFESNQERVKYRDSKNRGFSAFWLPSFAVSGFRVFFRSCIPQFFALST